MLVHNSTMTGVATATTIKKCPVATKTGQVFSCINLTDVTARFHPLYTNKLGNGSDLQKRH